MVEYQVYVESIYGSDVVVADTYEEAMEIAKDWSKTKKGDGRVIIEKVEKSIVAFIE